MYKEYSEKDYAIIGEYIVVFERILYNITTISRTLFKFRGLKQAMLVDVVFGQSSFTGFPKIAAFNSLVVEYMKVFDGEEKIKDFILKKNDFVYKSLVKHNEYRNMIVHSYYGTLYNKEGLYVKHVASKTKGNKKGYTRESIELETIKKHLTDLKNIENEFSILDIALIDIKNLKFNLRLQ